MVFYLKVNRDCGYTYQNIQHWIDCISLMKDEEVYIICDKDEIKEKIIKNINFGNADLNFIKSDRGEKNQQLIKRLASEKWKFAGLAHLTTFTHGKEIKADKFWNIDADDTFVCLSPERTKEMLEKSAEYAENNNIDAFSLDMWATRSKGKCWTFGVTYVNGLIDWSGIIEKYINYSGTYISFRNGRTPLSIDEYFSYLSERADEVNIQTFYADNLMFIHYSDDFILKPVVSGVYIWKNGRLEIPILKEIYGAASIGSFEIYKNAVKIDMDIAENESRFFLASKSQFALDVANVVEAKEYISMQKEQFMEEINKITEKNAIFYIWGCTEAAKAAADIMREKKIKPKGIIDNAYYKKHNEFYGLSVYSPEKLKEEDMDKCVILLAIRHFSEVKEQLEEMGCRGKLIDLIKANQRF